MVIITFVITYSFASFGAGKPKRGWKMGFFFWNDATAADLFKLLATKREVNLHEVQEFKIPLQWSVPKMVKNS